MKILKSWLRSDQAQSLFALMVAGLIWFFYLSIRWTRHVDPETEKLFKAGKPMIVCCWHGRMFVVVGGWHPRPRPGSLGFMTSGHRDGRMIGDALRHIGYVVVHGSSRRGGASALREMCRQLDKGMTMMITPDGPKGPRMRIKMGAVKAAQLSGAPMVTLTGSTSPRKVFGTWDRFCLPFPWARGVLHWGPPVYVPRDADAAALERCRLAIEQSMNDLTNEAERTLGQDEVPAAGHDEGPSRRARA